MLIILCNKWDNAESEFLDEEIECKRVEFLRDVDDFTAEVANKTFPQYGDRYAVASAFELDAPSGTAPYAKTIESLNEKARKVAKAHEELIRFARRRLAS